jgi:hypothetical protein
MPTCLAKEQLGVYFVAQGFLKFSVFLKWIVSQPFKIVAYGTGIVLVVVTWDTVLQQWGIPPLLFLRVILLVQIIWMGVLVSVFIYKVHIHNTSHCQPDVVCTLSAVLQGPPALDDVRLVCHSCFQVLTSLMLIYVKSKSPQDGFTGLINTDCLAQILGM